MGDTIKEFLVALGFKIDDAQSKKFDSAIANATHNVLGLGAATVATATAIGVSVEKIARQYEDLYYVGLRTNSAVSNLRSYEYAARQIGLTSDQARSSVEAMAGAMRMNPGLQGLLKSMGVSGGDGQKQLTGLMETLKNQFGEKGYFAAARVGSLFGLDETTFRMLWMNLDKLKQKQEDQKRRMKEAGVDADAMAGKWVDFSNKLDLLGDNFGILEERITADFLPAASAVIGVVNDMVEAFNRLNNATGGAAGQAGTIATSTVAALLVKRWLTRLLGGKAAQAAIAAGATAGGVTAGGVLATGGALVALGATIYPQAAGESDAEELARREKDMALQRGGSGKDRKQAVMDYFISRGWSKEQAAGLAANIARESNFKSNTVGDGGQAFGLAQWHPDRQAAFKQKFGKDIRDSSFEEQLAFMHHELTEGNEQGAGARLRRAGSAGEAGDIVSRYYERPRDVAGEAGRRGRLAETYLGGSPGGGNGGVSLTQQTTINVNGGDAAATGREVATQQDRVTGNAVRQMKGVLQ